MRQRYQPPTWWTQSLANGALGVALLHVERARTERASWATALAWLTHTAAAPVDDGPDSHLHYGAPALAYVLHHASTDTTVAPGRGSARRTGRYARAARKSATWASSSAAITDTCDSDSLVIPRDSTSFSIRRVETPSRARRTT